MKTPGNITVKTTNTARLECAARGHPPPEIAWRKDGGNDFPAARERRMHVMPTDDVFFILNVKTVDMGTYSCTAQNQAGMIIANASLTVEGQSVCIDCCLFSPTNRAAYYATYLPTVGVTFSVRWNLFSQLWTVLSVLIFLNQCLICKV